ncbi:MAG: hypothetical protein LBG19_10045 [Prevotellaceae bacterium]|jgi:hypothetical protein|nr:hypothetical protein [Prevotellaceae bacterium]
MKIRLSSPTFCQLAGDVTALDVVGTIEDRTEGSIIVEKYESGGEVQVSEPSTNGSFRIRFKNPNVTRTRDVRVEFTLSGADLGKDYTIETSNVVDDSEATIKAGQNGVVIPIKILNNHIVQGNRSLTLKFTNVVIMYPPE